MNTINTLWDHQEAIKIWSGEEMHTTYPFSDFISQQDINKLWYEGKRTYLDVVNQKMSEKTGAVLLLNEDFEKSQKKMGKRLQKLYGKEFNIEPWTCWSFKMIFKDNADIPVQVTVDWEAKNSPFWSLINLNRHYKDGKTKPYVCLNRWGDFYSDKTGVTVSLIYKDEYGRKWLFVLEEARPIQLAQKGPNARNLAGVTGMVDDGEHSLDTARREIQEELWLKTENGTSLRFMSHINLTSQWIMTEWWDHIVTDINKLERATDENWKITKVSSDRGTTRAIYVVPADRCIEWDKSMDLPWGAWYPNNITIGLWESAID